MPVNGGGLPEAHAIAPMRRVTSAIDDASVLLRRHVTEVPTIRPVPVRSDPGDERAATATPKSARNA
jgi:hypothetical protein